MEIRKVSIELLNPAAYNPRVDLQPEDLEYQKIKNSILTFGYVEPIIWNETTGNVVGGHQRLKILSAEGFNEISVSVVHMDLKQEKALNIALNKISGEWDESKLQEVLIDLDGDFDLLLTGFDEEELSLILDESSLVLAEDDSNEFDLVTVPKDPETIQGDIWIIGSHRLLCGDCTQKNDVKQLMKNDNADMIFTDPPYNVAYEGKTNDHLTIENDDLDDDSFLEFLKKVFISYYSIAKNGCPIYVCHADTESVGFRSSFLEAGFKLSEIIIWAKDTFVLGRQDYHWRHEPIIYGWKEGAAHFFIDDRTQDTVWEIKRPKRNVEHPTMKPLELCRRAISNSSLRGALIVDLFGGSGSTLIAADQLGRRCNMMEISPNYCDVIVRRYIDYKKESNSPIEISLIRGGESLNNPFTNI